ncbi:MAG: OmpA family protein [Myxococcota bacterium]
MISLILPALAQDATTNFEIFEPHADMYGYSAVQGAATLGNLQLGVGAWGNWSDDPLVMVDADGNRLSPGGGTADESTDGLVNSRVTTNFQVGMGFTRFASLTIDMPFIAAQSGWDLAGLDDPNGVVGSTSVTGIGDVVITPKGAILDRDYVPVGVAVAVPIGVPSGGSTDYLGEGGVTVAPKLIVELSDASIHQRTYLWRVAFNAGYQVRDTARIRDVSVGNEFQYGVGLGIHPAQPIEIDLEFHGATMGSRTAQNPAEALLTGKVLIGKWVAVNAGGGVGVLGGIGSPDLRLYGGVVIAPSFDPNAHDADKDDIPDGQDQCPKNAEDPDKYQDEDGCPELDNDAYGRNDDVDQCPNDPEDDDGHMDNDGCPDTDNDKDGVADAADRCPDQPEQVNGYMDDDGCPDDKPVEDSDGDGMKDDIDRCPYDAEDLNNFEDEDGCPDERLRTARVVVTKEAIKINDVIFFDFGKATIQERSYDLLNEIAQVIGEHKELKRIRIEGHTDNVGDDIMNLKLSQARAESVKAYLVSRGVDAARLDPRGFGEMNPISTNDTEEGRAQNRRVEFIIVDRD